MITIVGDSALEILSEPEMLLRLGDPCQAKGTEWSSFSKTDVESLNRLIPFDDRNPIHVLVDSPKTRVSTKRVVSHVWSGRVPPGSLYHLAPGVLVASPGFCYLLAAGTSSKARALSVGMECLGLYGRRRGTRGFSDRKPLLSWSELASYLEGAKGCYGVRNATRLLPRVLGNSRSPMETCVVLALTLPVREGGYGLPRPELNVTVSFPPECRLLAQRPYYEVDVCWERQRVALEYNSYADHLSRSSLDGDAMKANSLRSCGWKVLVATRAQLEGVALDVLARQVAHFLGVRARQPSARLRDQLLSDLL